MLKRDLATLIVLAAVQTLSAPPVSFGQDNVGFEEDAERIRAYWDRALSPDEYRYALQVTGMEAAINAAPDGPGYWTPIGPTGGVTGSTFNGRVSGISLRLATSIGAFVYVGACSGGLWRAHNLDGAGVWTSLGDRLPNPSVRAFAVQPSSTQHIVVGTGDWGRYTGAGMYRTTDTGASWTAVSLPVSPTSFGRIHWSATDPNVLVAACAPGGILRSTDAGVTWQVRLSGSATDLVLDPTNFSVQYACINGVGAFKSLDGGASWSQMTVTLPAGVGFGRGFIAVCRGAPANLALFLSQNEYQVMRSADGGATWTNITGPLGGWHMAEFGHTGAVAIRPDNPNDIFVGARGFLRTTDNGASWGTVTSVHADVTQLYFSPISGDDVLWICTDGGVVAHTLGGGTEDWNGNATTGLRCFQVYHTDAQRDIRAIGTQDNGTNYSTNGGASWIHSGGGDAWDCEIVNDLSMEFWYTDGVYGPPAFRVWRQRASGAPAFTNHTADGMDGLFYDRYTGRMYSIGDDDVIYASNVTAGTLSWAGEGGTPSFLHVLSTPTGSYVDGRTLYANSAGGALAMIARRSGSTWSVQTHDFGGTGRVASLYASTENAGVAWATLHRNGTSEPLIFQTVDYGATWTDVTGNLAGLKGVNCLVNKPFEPSTLYIGTDIGVFVSADGGATWQPFQTGLPVVSCTDMRYVVDRTRGGSDTLVVSTFGRGLYERTITSFPIVYVQQTASGTEDGTYEHPFNTWAEGAAASPPGGSLALYGGTHLMAPATLNSPMTLRAYGGIAQLR